MNHEYDVLNFNYIASKQHNFLRIEMKFLTIFIKRKTILKEPKIGKINEIDKREKNRKVQVSKLFKI